VEMIERASRAFDLLDGLGDDEISPWDRTLRAVAFEALDESQRAALRHLRRAQFAEARRIRQVVADAYLLTPTQLRCPAARPYGRGPRARWPACRLDRSPEG